MENKIKLVVHGRGNAWPVPLGGSHPFYDRSDPRDLSNAAYSLVTGSGCDRSEILVDAGHGTIQSLISGSNHIPDCICLTHGHMDHTLSVDWVVQSYWRLNKERYPLYATLPVFRFLVRSYPHLEELIDFMELAPGSSLIIGRSGAFKLTCFPVYHGEGAMGASMLLFESNSRRILFTGDLLTPLAGKKDLMKLSGIDLLVVDSNNRFPWPRTNHWSFAGSTGNPLDRNEVMLSWLEGFDPVIISGKQDSEGTRSPAGDNFLKPGEEWNLEEHPFTILEFLKYVEPSKVMLVHYSGMEDQKYYSEPALPAEELLSWATGSAAKAGIKCDFIIPRAGEIFDL